MTLNEVILDLQKLVELNPLAGDMQVVVNSNDYPRNYTDKTTDTVGQTQFSDDVGMNWGEYQVCVLIG